MKITVIIGSHQQDSQSHKVGKYIQHQINERDGINEVGMIDLGGNPIPLWDNTFWMEDSEIKRELEPYMKEMREADGYVIVSPEWGGMVPGGLKNFMLYWGQNDTGHKPAMAVGVSAGINGAYPIAELRSSGYKNSKIVYTPEHLIVRNVNDMMNDMDPNGAEKQFDKDIRKRTEHAVDCLVAYTKAFKQMREETDNLMKKEFPSGM